ncbi:MAG: GTPase Era [Erysipelotrichaceae bacterium]
MSYQSGFIAIIGRPNAGKSTLLNAILGQKVAIISPKAQTTRDNIQGILTTTDYQMIFTDTPGIHKPKHELGRKMNRNAYDALKDTEVIYFMVDASAPFGKGDEFLVERLHNYKSPVFLLLNKADLLTQPQLMQCISEWKERYAFAEIFALSALKRGNVDHLLEVTRKYLPEGFQYYPEDQISDHGKDFLMSEIVREKVLHFTEEEVPHSVAVVIEKVTEKNTRFYIDAMIVVERSTQKGIIIGKQGSMVKKIKDAARRDLEAQLGKKVDLNLYVRVEENWRNKQNKLEALGYGEDVFDDE